MIDITDTIRTVQAEYPPELRTARAMLALVEATKAARERVLDAIVQMGPRRGGTPEEQRQILLRELRRLDTRLQRYTDVLSRARPNDPMPREVYPLFHRITFPAGTPADARHLTPDYVTPLSIANQLAELEAFGPIVSNDFLLSVVTKAKEIRDKLRPDRLDQAGRHLEEQKRRQQERDRQQATDDTPPFFHAPDMPEASGLGTGLVDSPWSLAIGGSVAAALVVWMARRR